VSDANDAPFHVRFWLEEGGPYVPEVDYWISLAVPDDWLRVDEALTRDGLVNHDIWWRQSRFRIENKRLDSGTHVFFPKMIRWLEALIQGADDCGFSWEDPDGIAGAFHFKDGLRVCLKPPPLGAPEWDWRWKGMGGTREEVVRLLYEAFRRFATSDLFLASKPNMLSLIEALIQRHHVSDEKEWADFLGDGRRRGVARMLQAALHGVPCRPASDDRRWIWRKLEALHDDANGAAWDADLDLIEREVLTDAWSDWNKAQRAQHLLDVAFHLGPESYNTEYRNPATLRSAMIEQWLEETRTATLDRNSGPEG